MINNKKLMKKIMIKCDEENEQKLTSDEKE